MKLATINAAPDLVEQVHASILEAICSSELAAGQRITQEALAEQLGVSRQPVLQALKLLQGEGLIHDTPNKKGMIVAALDAAFVSNLYSIRAALDGLAARSAASFSRIDIRSEGIEILRAGRTAANQGDLKALVAADVSFHQFIYQSSGNALLQQTMKTHWHHTRRVMNTYLRLPASFRTVWNEHQAILDAIVAGNARVAEKLSREHALASVDFIFNHWQQDELKQMRSARRATT